MRFWPWPRRTRRPRALTAQLDGPRDLCVRCRRLLPVASMTDHGDDDWICRSCR